MNVGILALIISFAVIFLMFYTMEKRARARGLRPGHNADYSDAAFDARLEKLDARRDEVLRRMDENKREFLALKEKNKREFLASIDRLQARINEHNRK